MGFRGSWGLLETRWQKLLTEEPVDFLSRSPRSYLFLSYTSCESSESSYLRVSPFWVGLGGAQPSGPQFLLMGPALSLWGG